MPMSPEIRDREHSKFRDADNNLSKVAVKIEQPLNEPIPVAGTTISYKTIIDEVNKNLSYVGDAIPGTVTSASLWKIRRIQTSGSVTTVSFADGNSNFDNIWDNRASLTYS